MPGDRGGRRRHATTPLPELAKRGFESALLLPIMEAMALDPQLTSVVATAAVGWTMVATGRAKRMLETKRRRRRCPSCGLVIEGRTCDRHG